MILGWHNWPMRSVTAPSTFLYSFRAVLRKQPGQNVIASAPPCSLSKNKRQLLRKSFNLLPASPSDLCSLFSVL